MTDRTVNNLPAAAHGEPLRCLFAIELSTMSWVNTAPTTETTSSIALRLSNLRAAFDGLNK
jgi:hypothetical protein